MSVGTAVRKALYGKLTGDTTLRNLVGAAPAGYNTNNKAIYSEFAPAEVPSNGFPYVVFFQTSGVPMGDTLGARADIDNDLWTIKAVVRYPRSTDQTAPTNKSAQDAAEDIQARLDTLLTDGTITIAGATNPGTSHFLRRESDISYSEQSDGVVYIHRGALFRLIWQ